MKRMAFFAGQGAARFLLLVCAPWLAFAQPAAQTGTVTGATAHTAKASAYGERYMVAAANPLHSHTLARFAACCGERYMVAAANPLAVDAGARMLAQGGSAIDAAIAAALVLTLVEPEASGIGGGGFLLHFDKAAKAIAAYDGRETAPAAAGPNLFLDDGGQPLKFLDAVVGGKSVGVPGLLRMFEVAHARHGKLDWAVLFEPAIRLARQGFPLTPRVANHIVDVTRLKDQPAARAYFFHADGTPRAAGEVLRNPQLAAVFEEVARDGADAFYTGAIARDIIAAVQSHPANPGKLSADDMRNYRVRVREAVCAPYRAYRLCGMPPPSSGGIAVLQMLGMLARFPSSSLALDTAGGVHRFTEAGRLAYADRNLYVADPEFSDVPTAALLAPAYLRERSALIRPERSLGTATAGEPLPLAKAAAAGMTLELSSTSHLSIVDAEGNAVSLTQSIEYSFGSHLLVRGFLLNNQLTDFSFAATTAGQLVANRVQANKRPRSSMAPMLVFDGDNHLVGVVGSPGGSAIINYVAKVLVGVIDGGLDLQQAIAAPNVGSRNGPTELEKDRGLERLEGDLEALGHQFKYMPLISGVHGVWRTKDGWVGGADPRREGTALGK